LKRNKKRLLYNSLQEDPLSGVVNLFDVAMVFSVSLMVAVVSYMGIREFLSAEDLTLLKNPGSAQMEIIIKKGTKIEKYKATDQKGVGRGEKLGTAYRLESGEVIYVPEETEKEIAK
jgi:hypothetical protein